MEALSPLGEKVKEIRDRSEDFGERNYVMQGLIKGLNDRRDPIYISAPIRPEQLDTGTDPEAFIVADGLWRSLKGDTWHSFIPKKLGAHLKWSMLLFPINDKLTLNDWEEDENRVHEYPSSPNRGENRSVLLEFAIEYNSFFNDELSRPYLIHRIFHFLIHGQPSDRKSIEGTFENKSPRLTHTEAYSPICTLEEFRFIPYIYCENSESDGQSIGDEFVISLSE